MKMKKLWSVLAVLVLFWGIFGPSFFAYRFWTPEEDDALRQAVAEFETKNMFMDWAAVAEKMKELAPNDHVRTASGCFNRWHHHVRHGVFTPEEDEALRQIVAESGTRNWAAVAQRLNTSRNGKQCRERWVNHLSPDIKNIGPWTDAEDELLLRLRGVYGNRWAAIARFLLGRAENAVKNRFYNTLQRRQRVYPPRVLQNSVIPGVASEPGRNVGLGATLPDDPYNLGGDDWQPNFISNIVGEPDNNVIFGATLPDDLDRHDWISEMGGDEWFRS
jgi:hypothetical protein